MQFSSRPSLVRSVTVVLLSLVTGGKGGEGRLVKPGAGLIQPLCRRAGRATKGGSLDGSIGKGVEYD
jgi:hypothetical protein